MRYYVTFPGGAEVPVDLEHLPNGALAVSVEGRALDADAISASDVTALRVDGQVMDLSLEDAPAGTFVVTRRRRFHAKVETEQARAFSAALGSRGAAAGEQTLTSPMPGRVLKVLVAEGDAVTAGAPLVVVEAMKMENELVAARDGSVKKVFVSPGQAVESGARLVEIG
jgi:glutaconyl-CoA/methylmalonyl-CoA decarboxylase subunit gamma